jgi:hypothetical protein
MICVPKLALEIQDLLLPATVLSPRLDDNPPEHTIIIEIDITSSVAKNAHQKIDEHLRQQIITIGGDADVMVQTKHIDPALCI